MDRTYRISDLVEMGPFKRAKLFKEIREGRLRAHKAGFATIIHEKDWRAYLDTMPPRVPTGGDKGGDGARPDQKRLARSEH